MPKNTKIEALRAALIEGERSGASTPFDFDEFIARKRQGRTTSRSGGGLLLQCLNDGIRVVGDHRQQHLGGAIGTMGALLPVPHGSRAACREYAAERLGLGSG